MLTALLAQNNKSCRYTCFSKVLLVCSAFHTQCVLVLWNPVWCYLPVCCSGTSRPPKCDFCQRNCSCCAELPDPLNELKAHTQPSFSLNGEKSLAEKLGRLLSFEDCSWQLDPSSGFIVKPVVWHAQTHKQLSHLQSPPPPTHAAWGLRTDASFCLPYLRLIEERDRRRTKTKPRVFPLEEKSSHRLEAAFSFLSDCDELGLHMCCIIIFFNLSFY